MKRKRYISEIFNEKPEQWGLRGDPYLWDDIQQAFTAIEFPYDETCFFKDMHRYLYQFTGEQVNSKCIAYKEKYNYGGMSGGGISGEFWINRAMPLLLDRFKMINREAYRLSGER